MEQRLSLYLIKGEWVEDDFVGMEEHAKQLEKFSNKKVKVCCRCYWIISTRRD